MIELYYLFRCGVLFQAGAAMGQSGKYWDIIKLVAELDSRKKK